MSKLKTPQEKKRASLKHDCRNTYGESPHGSRKSIPKRKAMQHQQERRVANQALASVAGTTDLDAYESVEGRIKSQTRLKRLRGFRKWPDEALGVVVEQKQELRSLRGK